MKHDVSRSSDRSAIAGSPSAARGLCAAYAVHRRQRFPGVLCPDGSLSRDRWQWWQMRPRLNVIFRLPPWPSAWPCFLDGLDGRIARMTNTVSDFGREMDSLAD